MIGHEVITKTNMKGEEARFSQIITFRKNMRRLRAKNLSKKTLIMIKA